MGFWVASLYGSSMSVLLQGRTHLRKRGTGSRDHHRPQYLPTYLYILSLQSILKLLMLLLQTLYFLISIYIAYCYCISLTVELLYPACPRTFLIK